MTKSMEAILELWFDVGIKRDTTFSVGDTMVIKLWFDVGIKRDTTKCVVSEMITGCGLM